MELFVEEGETRVDGRKRADTCSWGGFGEYVEQAWADDVVNQQYADFFYRLVVSSSSSFSSSPSSSSSTDQSINQVMNQLINEVLSRLCDGA